MIIISIVTHNNADIIKDTILSILYYTKDVDYRIIVHDNDSTDDTVRLINSIKDDRVEVIDSKVNYGFGNGNNNIIKNYNGDYYLIYNPDVFLKSNIIKKLFEYMENRADVGMVTPKIVYANGELQYLCKENPTVFDLFFRRFLPRILKNKLKKRRDYYEMRNTEYNKEFVIPYATGAFMFFRGSILKRLGGFDENIFMYLEDADITRRLNKISKCVFYPYDKVVHLWAKGSHKSLKLTLINIKSAVYYFNGSMQNLVGFWIPHI